MGKKSVITQNRIAETARELFIEKGYDGVKMQELADRAGVNKGLIHHYFKNKSSIFKAVFIEAIDELFGKIGPSLAQPGGIDNKINAIVDAYFDMLLHNPQLPIFVFFELNKNPQELLKSFNTNRISMLINGLKTGNPSLDERQAIHIIITIISLCVFPFIAKPVVMQIAHTDDNFSKIIEERRPMIKLLVSNLVKTL